MNLKHVVVIAIAIIGLFAASSAAAQDAAVVVPDPSAKVQKVGDPLAGKTKSVVCASCHGVNGIGVADIYPNLCGQKAAYIVKQLKDFKKGRRTNDHSMPSLARSLKGQDMRDIAAHFSAIPCPQ